MVLASIDSLQIYPWIVASLGIFHTRNSLYPVYCFTDDGPLLAGYLNIASCSISICWIKAANDSSSYCNNSSAFLSSKYSSNSILKASIISSTASTSKAWFSAAIISWIVAYRGNIFNTRVVSMSHTYRNISGCIHAQTINQLLPILFHAINASLFQLIFLCYCCCCFHCPSLAAHLKKLKLQSHYHIQTP